MTPRLAWVLGDPAGIGPELVAKSLVAANTRGMCRPVMNTLIDMSELNIPFQLTGMLALRPYLKSNPDTVLSVIRVISEGIHFYKPETEATLKILGKYLKTADREALEETHREIAIKALPEKPYPTLAGVKTLLDETALRNPKAKGLKPEDFVDSSVVKRVDDEGLFEKLYKR